MASVESSSSSMFTASGRMRKGVGGLASGLDTDELVKGMTTSTRSKIAKQLQDKDRLEWRANSIRGISTKLIDFQDKYLSYSSKTNLFSENFFEQRTITPVGLNSKYVTVTGNSNGLNDLSIEAVTQLAQDAGFTSGTALQDELLTGDIKLGGRNINDLGGEILRLTYGNLTFNVAFPEDFGLDPVTGEPPTPPLTTQQVADKFNDLLKDIKFKENGVQYNFFDRMEMKVGVGNKITLEQKVSGDQKGIAISGGTGEVLNILGLDTMETTQTAPINGEIDHSKMVRSIGMNDLAGKKISFSYNGVQKTITFPSSPTGKFDTNANLATFLNGEFDRLFGANKIAATVNGDKLSFKTYDGRTPPSVDDNSVFKLVSGDKDTLGFKGVFQTKIGEGNRVNFNNAIKNVNFKTPLSGLTHPAPPAPPDTYDIEINGSVISFNDTDSMADIVQKINDANLGVKVKYMETTNRLSVVATEPGTSGKVSIKDVAGGGNLAEALFGNDPATSPPGTPNLRNVTDAKDAIVSIKYGNGTAQTIIRNTNAFDLDGLHISVTGKFTTDPVTFDSKMETENVTKAVSEMIDDFNELLKLVNDTVSEKRDRKYPPLTEEQKEGMTEKQIEAWEKKAKAGILFNDTNIRGLSSDLRFTLSLGIDGKEDLSAFGIKVSTEYEDNGKLIFDEAVFKKALEERPEDVKNVFTKPIVKPTDGSEPNPFSGGIMARMKNVYDKYAATTGSEKGILIKEAGLDNSLTTLSSSIYKQMNDIDEIVARLRKQLIKEEDRYYRQFTRLEQEVAKMNSQGSWLNQQTQ